MQFIWTISKIPEKWGEEFNEFPYTYYPDSTIIKILSNLLRLFPMCVCLLLIKYFETKSRLNASLKYVFFLHRHSAMITFNKINNNSLEFSNIGLYSNFPNFLRNVSLELVCLHWVPHTTFSNSVS